MASQTENLQAPWKARQVTAAVINYNGIRILEDCLKSVFALDERPGEVILLDDGSTDGSPEWAEKHFPEMRVVRMGENTKRLNKVRNRALAAATKDLVLLVDNDVILKKDCLELLLEALNTLPKAAVCMPRALYHHDHSLIYQDGQILHYVGASWMINRNEPAAGTDEKPRISEGWGIQLINRKKAAEVGNFNEEYVMGWADDGEFNHRMNLVGNFCYHVPRAIVFHKRTQGARRYYGGVRNRWRFLLENYQAKTLVLCLPALAIYEFSLMLFLLKKGALKDYVRGIGYVLSHLGSIGSVRKRVQSRRKMRDRELMTSGNIFISPEYVDSRILSAGYRAMNMILDGYWSVIKTIL